jgi:predicted CxxxxCH...CXXCH cytochrome family protein
MSDCSACHGEVVGQDDVTITARERHVDGVVDVAFDSGCTACHGRDNPAPPRGLQGETTTSASGVGAHQAHLAGSSRARAVTCEECHLVPERVLEPGHVDSFAPVEVTFSGAATAFGASPSFTGGKCSNTACHGGSFPVRGHDSGGTLTTPAWTVVDGSQATCGSCHGLPPPRPHPYHSEDCGRCHENVSLDGKTFLRPELHVDGIVTFAL